MNYLEIISPANESIAVAGRAVTFTALLDRLDRGKDIVWSLASKPGAKTFGAECSLHWTVTGVDQVVASVDGLTCAVTIYIFKTPSGRGTVADLMQSEPPPLAQSAGRFPDYPVRAYRSAS